MDYSANKRYWKEYMNYWEEKVEEANLDEKKEDKTISDDVLEYYIQKLDIQPEAIILDYGCGYCRAYPICRKICNKNSYYGVDIVNTPLSKAIKKYPELKERLKENNGVELPYPDNYFDYIICFGVFDACEQTKILNEFFRVLKVNGKLLLSGKNNYYEKDDEKAYIAEVNARKKGHPNYFTDTKKMENDLQEWIVNRFYFVYRGDSTEKKYKVVRPDRFYEWIYYIEKKDMMYSDIEIVSDKYSKTWRKR